jgi:hypothetical protein
MRLLISTVLLIYATIIYGQQCRCETDTSLNEVISCKVIYFKNHSKLYWQFNCDSSWLTFENKYHEKTSLYILEDGLMGYTEKLGYSFAGEYASTFMIQNNLISGCCTPAEYILFNKSTGKELKNLGSLIFYSDKVKYPLVVSFADTNFNTLKFYNVNAKQSFSVSLPRNKIKNTLKKGEEVHPEYLFEEPVIDKGSFSVSFRYQDPGNNDDWHDYKVVVDLKKYGY